MKKYLILIIIATLMYASTGFAAGAMGLLRVSGGGESAAPSCDTCTTPLMFSWYGNDPTVGDTGYSPCGCSAGDSEGAAQGTVQTTGGAVVTTDTGTDGADYYNFDVSSADIIECGGTGTIFIRFESAILTGDSDTLFAIFTGITNYFYVDPTADDVRVKYTDSGTEYTLASGATLSVDTIYWVRIAWQDSSPYVTIQTYDDNAGAMGASKSVANETTQGWDITAACAGDDFKVGNWPGTNAVHKIYYIAVYDDVRTTEP